MKFGTVPTSESAGSILAHSVQAGAARLKKGCILRDADVVTLLGAGIAEITVAQLEAGDIHEDRAAQVVAEALRGPHISLTKPLAGRVNLVATADGVLSLKPEVVTAVNRNNEAITLATRPDFAHVRQGMLLATVKIIPYGAPCRSVKAVLAEAGSEALAVVPFVPKTYDLILTRIPGFKQSLLIKGRQAVQTRANVLGWTLKTCVTVDHDRQAVARALTESEADVALVLGASATSDRRDVIPAGLVAAGGEVIRFGMPVDPGNLLVLGRKHGQTVIGLPGCARAPALNGVDWVMERIAADLPVTNDDFSDMGLGGLLKEIPDRIQPRALHAVSKPCMAAVLLAAGASRRMGGENKLLRHIDGVPLLRRSTETLLASGIDYCVVVIPANAADHRRALEGLPVTIIEATDAARGMSASLCAGLAALPDEAEAVLIALADMPDLTPEDIIRVIEGHDPDKGQLIVCPLDDTGRRGHPVLFDRRYFENLQDLSGDTGAREVLQAVPDQIVEVHVGAAVTQDLDTPQDWADWDRQTKPAARGSEAD